MISKILNDEIDFVRFCLVVPVRICDVGGWVDTHFSGHGFVQNLSVLSRPYFQSDGTKSSDADTPYSGVVIDLHARKASDPCGFFRLIAPDVQVDKSFAADDFDFDRTDLLNAAMEAVGIPPRVEGQLFVSSVIPSGASTGTSAGISIGITSAFEYLKRGEIDPYWVARKTHEIETVSMGLECGVQDQGAIAAACGATYVDIYRYPNFSVSPIHLDLTTIDKLESGFLTFVYGKPHKSSDVHRMVIGEIVKVGRLHPGLERIRLLAPEARYCLLDGDIPGYGQVLDRNTECQRELHPKLISNECQSIIDWSRQFDPLGGKVNGAGGHEGGSYSILFKGENKHEAAKSARGLFPSISILEHKLASGGLCPKIVDKA